MLTLPRKSAHSNGFLLQVGLCLLRRHLEAYLSRGTSGFKMSELRFSSLSSLSYFLHPHSIFASFVLIRRMREHLSR